MTKRTQIRQPELVDRGDHTHQLLRALFQLRLDLKALAAAISEDDAIAHPTGISIDRTAFHGDALGVVCTSGRSLLSKSVAQVGACLRAVPTRGDASQIESAINAIKRRLESLADQLNARPFTNDRRIMASLICADTCDLCALAIQNFAVRHFVEIET